MSAITVMHRGHEPVFSDTDWKLEWPCGCFVLTGWNSVSGTAAAMFGVCEDSGPHAAPMQRASERYAAMCAQPAAHRELAEKNALDVIYAIAAEELA